VLEGLGARMATFRDVEGLSKPPIAREASASRRPDCLAGHIGLEPANPGASYLLGFA
jgi:hypothetical protein